MVMRFSLVIAILIWASPLFSQNQFKLDTLTFSQDLQGYLNWVDLDNDGDLDVINHNPGYYVFDIYENINNEFILKEAPFNSVYISPPKYALADYDNDNDIDLLLMDMQNLAIAINQGNISFDVSFTSINGNSNPSIVHWVDLDGDSKYDIVLDDLIFFNRNNEYQLSNIKLPNSTNNIHWVDLNNDGYTDFIGGKGNTINSNPLLVFLNKGEGIFEEGQQLAPTLNDNAPIVLLDIDNDADADLVFQNPDGKVIILKNQYSESKVVSFIETFSINKFDSNKIALGDINSDDLPDIVLHGSNSFGPYSTFAFINNSTGNMVEFIEEDLGISSYYTEHFGLVDFDQDGDLDINVLGVKDASYYVYQVLIYENTFSPLPSIPLVPNNLNVNLTNSVELSWESSIEYPNYNVEIARNGEIIKSSLTLADGTLLWPGTNQLSFSNSKRLINLPEGEYEWRVQAVSHSKRSSAFSPKNYFKIEAPPTNLTYEIVDITEIKLSWQFTGLNPTAFVVLRKSTSSPYMELATIPASEKSYTDKNIPSNQLHEYIVKAVFGDINSAPSSSVRYFSGQFGEEPFDKNTANIIESYAEASDFDKDGDYDLGFIGRIDYQFGNSLILTNDGTGKYDRSSFIPNFSDPYTQNFHTKDMDNDGDTDVCVVFGNEYSAMKVIVYHNEDGLFTKAFETSYFLGINQMEVEDLNNDGRQDIIFSYTIGNSTGNPKLFTILYQNVDGDFVDSGVTLTNVDMDSYQRVKISDLNNDGFKDIFLFGVYKPKVFLNQNGNTWKEFSTSTFPLLGEPIFYDFNADGKMDIIQGAGNVLEFYAGLGDLKFAERKEVSIGDMGYSQPVSILVADIDLNGMPDLLVNDGYRVGILQGAKDGSFTLSDYKFPFAPSSQIQVTNMDNDADLDLVRLGTDGQHEGVHFFYRNQIATINKSNSPPTAPASVQVIKTNNGARISWSPSTDLETPQNFLTYNVHIVDSNGKTWLHSEANESFNFRYRLASGNAGHRKDLTINNLPSGNYRVYVQALDASFAMSSTSPEVSFTVSQGPTSLSIERILLNKVKLTWVNSSATLEKIIVERRAMDSDFEVIKELPSSATQFTDENLLYNVKYSYRVYGVTTGIPTANSNTEIWNTTLFSLKQTNIPNVSGPADAGDFNADGRMDLILSGSRIDNGTITQTLTDILENNGNSFNRISIGSNQLNFLSTFRFYDFNEDNRLDVYQHGYSQPQNRYVTELFINNGDKTFSETNNIFTDNDYGILNTWDYDMDNDFDYVVTNSNIYGSQQVIRNKSNGQFEVDVAQNGSCNNCIINRLTADFNGDGMEDVWRANSNGDHTLYLNSSKGLSDSKAEPIGLNNSSLAVVDYNSDGYNDIIMLSNEYYMTSRIYKNLGYDEENKKHNGFKIIKSDLPSPNAKLVAADFDHDGDTDLFFITVPSKLYLNKGDDNFEEVTFHNLRISSQSPQLIDVDNDEDLDIYVGGYFPNFTGINETMGMVIENQLVVDSKGRSNLPPGKPFSLASNQDEMGMHLSWQPAADDHTLKEAQTFDVIIFGQGKRLAKFTYDEATGKRLKLQGGTSSTNNYTVNNLVPGEYTWVVQAVDQSYRGSVFSESGSFLFRPLPPAGINDTIIYKCDRQVTLTAKGQNIEWFSNAEVTNKIATGPTFQPQSSGIVYVTQTVEGLRSFVKKVTITIADRPPFPVVTSSNPAQYCADTQPGSFLFLTVQGSNVKWYSDANKVNLIKENTEILQVQTVVKNYFVTQTLQGCESLPLEIQVKPLLIEADIYIENGKLRVKEESGNSYFWYKDNIQLVNQNSFILNMGIQPGTYKVVIVKGFCVETSGSFIVTDINHELLEFALYPNPATHTLTVQTNNIKQATLKITDVSGRNIYEININETSQSSLEIDIKQWSSGIYFLICQTQNQQIIKKFVVKNEN
jgi:hypothetical protein